MNDPNQHLSLPEQSRIQPNRRPTFPGPNLTLIYSLIALALAAAIALAMLIVFPFYHRR